MATTWTDWLDYDQPASFWGFAAYEYRLSRNGRAIPINRFLKTDKEGILCIGEANNMESRRKAFYNSTLEGGYGHPSGKMLGMVAELTLLKEYFPGCSYQYRFIRIGKQKEPKESAKRLQDKRILCYILSFGDLPR